MEGARDWGRQDPQAQILQQDQAAHEKRAGEISSNIAFAFYLTHPYYVGAEDMSEPRSECECGVNDPGEDRKFLDLGCSRLLGRRTRNHDLCTQVCHCCSCHLKIIS